MQNIVRRRRRLPQLGLVVAVSLVSPLFVASQLFAIHRDTPFLSAMTHFPGGSSVHAKPSKSEPTWIGFESTNDLLGNGSTGRQIFLYHLRVPRFLGQITHFAGDSFNPSVAGSGVAVAFDSAADILGSGSTARQIYVWTRDSGSFTQLTNGTADSTHPDISVYAEAVAFQSQADLLNNGSTGTQVFVHNLLAGNLVQVTYAPGDSLNPVVTKRPFYPALGQAVFFDSDAPLLGPPSGYRQIYQYDFFTGQMTQLTFGAGDSVRPSTDDSGRLVAFQSQADLLNNGSTGWQIFLLDVTTGSLRQITQSFLGDSTAPSMGRLQQFVTFTSTADLLSTGAVGQHVFLYDLRSDLMFQVTKDPGTISQDPMVGGGNFIIFDTNEDLMNTGITGRQVYAVDTWRRTPRNIPVVQFGERDMTFLPGRGSALQVTARDWTSAGVLSGKTNLFLSQRDFDAKAIVKAPKKDVVFDPIPVAGLGVICLKATADATGVYYCAGGRPGGDLLVTQDHNTIDVDSGCALGCRDELACDGFLAGPHVGMCKGPVRNLPVGTYAPGGMQLRLPVSVGLSVKPAPDGTRCTAYDEYAFRLQETLLFTTGAVTATINDADAVSGATLTTLDQGTPFECMHLEASNFGTAELVAALPLLDLPLVPTGLRDTIFRVHLVPFERKPFVAPCTGLACQILTVCVSDAECSNQDACDGEETCVNGQCTPATPIDCDDGAVCTADACDPTLGCTHTSIFGCCVTDADCSDSNVCDGLEQCIGGNCVSGTPLACDDGIACNGTETCNPLVGCQAAIPLAPFTAAGVACQLDTIEARLRTEPESTLGGHHAVIRFLQSLTVVRRFLAPIYRTGDPRKPNFRAALRALNGFAGALDRGVARGKIDPIVGEQIANLARDAIQRILQVRAGGPVT
jgi:Tol biopolymer transport system component